MIRYFWCVKTDDFRTRDQKSPYGKLEVRRDSKAARKSAHQEFCRLMWNHAPAGHEAKAWLERTDSHGHTTTLATFTQERSSASPAWKSPAGDFATQVILCGVTNPVDSGPSVD